jgi:hypothetical protein
MPLFKMGLVYLKIFIGLLPFGRIEILGKKDYVLFDFYSFSFISFAYNSKRCCTLNASLYFSIFAL